MSFRSRLRAVAPALLLSIPGALVAQESERPQFGLGIEVSEVLLDVLVADAAGHVILGLRPEDFLVSSGGERLEVVSATFYSNRRLVESPAARQLGVDPSAVPDRRLFVLFFDDQALRALEAPELLSRQRRAGRDALRWVESGLAPGDLVAVAGFRRSHLALDLDFSADRAAIRRAVERAARGAEPPAVRPSRHAEDAALPALADALPAAERLRAETPTVEQALAIVADAARPIVGRKNLVLFTSGFGDVGHHGLYRVDARRYVPLVQAMNAANVAAYVIDLVSPLASHSLEGSASQLAADTGGRAFFGRPAFDSVLGEIATVTNGYYLVAVRDRHASGESGYRELTVALSNPEFRVTARRGYRFGSVR